MRTKKRLYLTRRDFLAGSIGITAGAIFTKTLPESLRTKFIDLTNPVIPGQIVGAASKVGHMLRSGVFPNPSRTFSTDYLIVGGGMAGLSAAWWLDKQGVKDYLLLELEENVGGNSQWGKNSVSAYPWGAHYVPIPSLDSELLIALFEEIGVIQGRSPDGIPIYNELYLSSDPQERVFAKGRWQEGLIPSSELTALDRAQFAAFFSRMDQYRGSRGKDGRRLFSIPIDQSSEDEKTRALDQISMADFLKQNGWDSPRLQWYVNYCCRDDYGAAFDRVSAWAGIHYFASRDGHGANAEKGNVITWPEGNGWIVQKLKEKASSHIQSSALVFNVSSNGDASYADYYDVKSAQVTRVHAHAIIFAGPRFVAARILDRYRNSPPPEIAHLEYSPWMVANLTLASPLESNLEAPLCWDNVLFESPSLGYVNAGNQKIERYPRENVLTYYWPLSHLDPAGARQEALEKTHGQWAEEILRDLSGAHPDLRDKVSNIDVWLWGHGMIRPKVGYIWGEARRRLQAPEAAIFFAHTDMSGISIFEEAQYQGVKAAKLAIEFLSSSSGKPA